MNKCPQCGQKRQGDGFKCPQCDCFYSELDEILATELAEKERHSFKGRLKAVIASNNPRQALHDEIAEVWQTTPKVTLFTLAVIFLFVFALIVSV